MKPLFWTGFALLFASCGPTNVARTDAAPPPIDARPDAPPDFDGDGYDAAIDCNDMNRDIHPGAQEICDDAVDNNCDDAIDHEDLACLTPCERAVRTNSYLGCQFYAIDLPQYSLDKIYGISVSNPDSSLPAHVTISTTAGPVANLVAAPRGVATYQDPTRAQNAGSAGVTSRIFRIDSDLPVAAYQFNSIDTIGAASTDASLLFASHTLATRYYVMDYQAALFGDNSFIGVYATQPDTVVTITPTAAVNGPTSVTLQPMQSLIVSASSVNVSLTGSRVEADKPIGVFGGNRCTQVPYGMPYCDHLEEQIFPRQAIGTHYVVGKLHARHLCNPADYVRVLADADNTTVTFNPPVVGPWTLNAGEWMETTITGSVEVTGTNPILVGEFMRSSNGSECGDEGDPSFLLQVPSDQYRTDYIFLTPTTYDTDYVAITAPLGASIALDGNLVTLDPTEVGASGHTVTSVVLPDGPHVISSNVKFGIMVYAYGGPGGASQNVSYGFPGGLDLNPINPVE